LAALAATASIAAAAGSNVTGGSAAGGNSNLPTWWTKLQVVSAPGFRPAGEGHPAGSVSVSTNVDVSNETGPQSETSIAINPNNGSQIVAGANEIDRLPMRGFFSNDGGKSWGGVDLPLPPALTNNGFDFGSDPGVAWDTKGNVYYAFIVVFFSAGGAINGTEMAVAKSTDGGQTWPIGQVAFFALETGTASFNDKPMITVDTNPLSPNRDTIYVGWDHASFVNGKPSSIIGLLVSHSTDGGSTFSAPVRASTSAPGPKAVIGADPFVAPDGTLHVAWQDVQNTQLSESSSADGGLTFGPTHVIAPTQVAFDIGIPPMNSRRALIYPACGADASTGPNRGALYCAWMDGTLGGGVNVFIAKSIDGGQTWSAQRKVNDDAALADHFNQWLAVDPSDGSVSLSWNDTRNDPTRVSTDIFYARSTDGGITFAANVQVTTAPTNETCCGADLGNQYGDYEGIAVLNGIVHPVWTDRRAAVASLGEEVFTSTIVTTHG
jgi:hypothetical protein